MQMTGDTYSIGMIIADTNYNATKKESAQSGEEADDD